MIQGRLCVRYHVEIQRVMRSCPCLKKFMRWEAGSSHCQLLENPAYLGSGESNTELRSRMHG